jgi:MinD-like ATPase involved in chromosome partitioning or flagellar assembly
MTKSIAVVSLGRGHGKTTVAVNLGLALHNMNHKVLVLDSDFTRKNLMEHLNIEHIPVGVNQVFEDKAHINDTVYKHISGLRIIPSSVHSSIQDDYDKFRFHYEDLMGTYDYIIMDTPMQQQYLEKVLPNANEALIVHSPTTSTRVVSEAVDLLSKLKIFNLGVVLNNVSERSTDSILNYPVLEKIPTHKHFKQAYAMKNPLLHTHPKSPMAKKFNRLAARFE